MVHSGEKAYMILIDNNYILNCRLIFALIFVCLSYLHLLPIGARYLLLFSDFFTEGFSNICLDNV